MIEEVISEMTEKNNDGAKKDDDWNDNDWKILAEKIDIFKEEIGQTL